MSRSMATNRAVSSGRGLIGGGITIENSGSYDSGVNGYLASHNFTATGTSTNGTLVVFVYNRRVTTEVTSVLADGKSMKVVTASQGTDVSGVAVYVAHNVDTSVSVSIKTPAFKIVCATWVYLSGFDRGDTVVTANSKTQGTAGSISNDIVSSSTGDFLLSGINTLSGVALTPSAGYTQAYSFEGADVNMGQCALIYRDLGAQGTYTPGWTFSSQDSQTMASIIIRKQSSRDIVVPDLVDFFSSPTIDTSVWDTATAVGTWNIENGTLHVVKSGNDWANNIIISQKKDFTAVHIVAGVKFPTTSAPRQIVFRTGITANSGYGIQLRSGQLKLENWGFAGLATASKTIDAGAWHWIEVIAVGNRILAKTWEDGTSAPSEWDIDFTDTANLYTSGAVGFSMEVQGADEDGYFRDITVNGRALTRQVSP